MSSSQTSQKPLLTIQFVGQSLQQSSIPIYDLGQCLVAMQRIVHKTYFIQEQRPVSRSRLSKRERTNLALRISSREAGSDLYNLVPFTTDPALISLLQSLLVDALKALGVYVAGKLFTQRKEDQVDLAMIYAEVSKVAERVEGITDAESIRFSMPGAKGAPSVAITKETKEYVRHIRDQQIEGEIISIGGKAVTLFPPRDLAEIAPVRLLSSKATRAQPSTKVKIHLTCEDFNRIRYQTDENTELEILGMPLYRMGLKSLRFREFKALDVAAHA